MSDSDPYPDPIEIFAASGMVIPRPTEEDIQKKAAVYSQSIFQSRSELYSILNIHEETIRKRWAKKTVKQRETLLRSAYPEIPVMHRPDLWALRQETREKRRSDGTKYRDAFLLPELNLEDLVKPKNILLLFNSRGRNSPDIFAFTDFEKIRLARTSEAVPIPFKNECTIYLTGQNAKSYGKLVYWNEGPDVFNDMVNGVGMLPGAGLIVLESQYKLYNFLLKTAKTLIHDLLPLTNSEPAPDPPSLDDPDLLDLELSSIAAYATGTTYRAPLRFDVKYLKRLAEAKVDQAQDHLWSLREDPSYFRDVALEYSEHRLEHLLTKPGARHPNLNTAWLWDQIFLGLIGNAYTSLLQWQLIEQQLEQVERLRTKYASQITNQKALPSEYDDHMSHFQYFLQQFLITGPVKDLKMGAFGSPPMRPWFNRYPQDPNSTMIGIHSSAMYQNSPSSVRPQVIELISLLLDEKQSVLMGRHIILDEIDRLLRSDPKERACITSWVLNYLSEMSSISEFLRQLEFHQPRIGCNTTFPVDLEHIIPDDPDFFDGRSVLYEKTSEPLTRITSPMKQRDVRGRVMALVDPATSANNTPLGNGKFNYPVHKKASQAVVEQMRRAEAELDAFWAKFDGIVERRTGKKPNILLREFVDQREVERTPQWTSTSPLEPAPQRGPSNSAKLQDKFALLDLEQRTESTLRPELNGVERFPPKKRKTKTKAIPTPAPDLPLTPLGNSESQRAPNTSSNIAARASTFTISVPRRAYTVFTRLFFTPSPDRTPGEVAWSDFVQAMVAAGCAVKRLMGSSWMFSRAQSDNVGSADAIDGTGAGPDAGITQIIFHAPHPAANIPIHIVRKHGRRLARRWGWNIDLFGLKESTDSK
ncbi:hypothetical protein F5050DRAFT_1891180 [Lentinula boryana]|uniref:Uncharacterized protein n=1 Tax=Lentinula boryana TaxID=40481 RepID=A0ABQ8QSU2_9AGAR|nr:hypothetical protein F5050DRAFT_1891180 [Lentinula boryana]